MIYLFAYYIAGCVVAVLSGWLYTRTTGHGMNPLGYVFAIVLWPVCIPFMLRRAVIL